MTKEKAVGAERLVAVYLHHRHRHHLASCLAAVHNLARATAAAIARPCVQKSR
jgi:hypothetical protein